MYTRITGIILIAFFGCTAAQAQVKSAEQITADARSQVKQISVDEFRKKHEQGEKVILVDVRTEQEFLAGYIEGAVWIPRGKVEFGIQQITKDPKADIVVYCRTGGRSSLSAVTLGNIGYERVLNLDGGFKAWVEAGNSAFNMHGEIKVVNFEKKERE